MRRRGAWRDSTSDTAYDEMMGPASRLGFPVEEA